MPKHKLKEMCLLISVSQIETFVWSLNAKGSSYRISKYISSAQLHYYQHLECHNESINKKGKTRATGQEFVSFSWSLFQ